MKMNGSKQLWLHTLFVTLKWKPERQKPRKKWKQSPKISVCNHPASQPAKLCAKQHGGICARHLSIMVFTLEHHFYRIFCYFIRFTYTPHYYCDSSHFIQFACVYRIKFSHKHNLAHTIAFTHYKTPRWATKKQKKKMLSNPHLSTRRERQRRIQNIMLTASQISFSMVLYNWNANTGDSDAVAQYVL